MISTVTPLCAALLIGDVSLARYLYEILFLTNSDVSSLTRNKDIRHILEVNNLQRSINFLHEISLQPLSLFQLTFVSVSSALGPSPGREHRVSKLPIPQAMKDKLLFKSGSNVPEWNFSE
uniref:SOCS box domain-containing protein n=1 Tax=Arion vulgaris TaxID=1028688 RepID=A0A0B7AST2_9EUPU